MKFAETVEGGQPSAQAYKGHGQVRKSRAEEGHGAVNQE
jgi:hypothetical protein